MPTFTNNRTGESVSLNLTNSEIAAKFAEFAPADSWLWFWLAKTVSDSGPKNKQIQDMTTFLGDMFLYAVGMGLKKPMIRAQFQSRRYKLYLSAKGTLCLKSGAVAPGTSNPVGDEEYVGCFLDGKFLPPGRGYGNNGDPRRVREDEQHFIDRLTAEPVNFLAECGRDMDRCCYCNLPLSDPRSKVVGYGKTCASRWGLPWGEKEFQENVPSFADLWAKADRYGGSQETIRGLLAGIRTEPMNSLRWLILNDALREAGWPEERVTTPPAKSFIVPRS